MIGKNEIKIVDAFKKRNEKIHELLGKIKKSIDKESLNKNIVKLYEKYTNYDTRRLKIYYLSSPKEHNDIVIFLKFLEKKMNISLIKDEIKIEKISKLKSFISSKNVENIYKNENNFYNEFFKELTDQRFLNKIALTINSKSLADSLFVYMSANEKNLEKINLLFNNSIIKDIIKTYKETLNEDELEDFKKQISKEITIEDIKNFKAKDYIVNEYLINKISYENEISTYNILKEYFKYEYDDDELFKIFDNIVNENFLFIDAYENVVFVVENTMESNFEGTEKYYIKFKNYEICVLGQKEISNEYIKKIENASYTLNDIVKENKYEIYEDVKNFYKI